ncbi:XdhC family protein [Zwartia vadi]|uniref:XdhC family protein n=1 Tax=Zwartia vadi TaxID=3058168 RepID=UPI0025B2BEF6|nr:XdhC family protein [Zwartia vadi]MDN3987345.1 XdhC family protein [Zwartia vadi]
MDSLDTEVLKQAQEWVLDGHLVHLATVVKTWGSAPRQAGAMLAVRQDGRVVGSVSGGCIEDDLIVRAQQGRLPSKPEWARYGVSQEEAARFGLPCGGTLRLVIEPLTPGAWLEKVVSTTQEQKLIGRWLDMYTGVSTLTDARPGQLTEVKEDGCHFVYGPHWRLLIIGANQTARALAQIATMLEFQVIICDPREEFTADWDMPGVSLLPGMPDDAVLEIQTDSRTAIVAITHDPKLDDMALLEALKSEAFYVGALGSVRNQSKRRERLLSFDLSEQEVNRLYGPVGLPIGSRTPAEIAVAVGAQLVQVRRALDDARVSGLSQPPASTA